MIMQFCSYMLERAGNIYFIQLRLAKLQAAPAALHISCISEFVVCISCGVELLNLKMERRNSVCYIFMLHVMPRPEVTAMKIRSIVEGLISALKHV